MKLWLSLQTKSDDGVVPGGKTPSPSACLHAGCDGRRFRVHQAVAKPVRQIVKPVRHVAKPVRHVAEHRDPPPPASPPDPAARMCPQIDARVPVAAIHAAPANPWRIDGYRQSLDPGKPVGPYNLLRAWLSLHVLELPYQPLGNGLAYKAWCP